MTDLNAIFRKRVIRAREITAVLVATFIYGMSIIACHIAIDPRSWDAEPLHTLTNLFIVTWLLMFLGMFVLVARIYAFTMQAEGRKFKAGNAAAIVGLSLLFWASLPFLQTKLNSLVRARPEATT
ncbi:MAG: hypothetical protein ACRD9W_02080 [Terriglobia bacterium]